MEDGLFTNQGKKLMLVGIFLWGVAMLIGGEDDPGVIAQVGEDGANGLVAQDSGHNQQASAPLPQAARVQSRPQQDPALADWYAEAGPVEPVEPEPVDESHLINDTVPAVSTEPLVQ
ncbi:hypothetical protein [Erythrobacter sp.]|uniref:hypothetical protein n=1 Tax=Erythrobacter sp. TaxID=1042 RepID=UPI00311D8108